MGTGRRTIRSAVPLALVALALLTLPAPAAGAPPRPVVGTPALDDEKAVAKKNDLREGREDVKCPVGAFGYRLWSHGFFLDGAHWVTYPSITWVSLFCSASTGEIEDRDFGDYNGGAEQAWCWDVKFGVLIGVKVASDAYVKDMKPRCGKVDNSGSSPRVIDRGYRGGWVLGHVQNNDDKKALRCDSSQVVTGMRFDYRRDRNETAITSVRLFCSEVSYG